MVRGITRQVIMVKSPDARLFEEALFLLREDALEKHGVTERELIEEARRIAQDYTPQRRPRRGILSPLLYLTAGAAPVGLAWLLSVLI